MYMLWILIVIIAVIVMAFIVNRMISRFDRRHRMKKNERDGMYFLCKKPKE